MLKVFLSIAAFSVCFLIPHEATAAQSAKLLSVSVKRSNSGVSVDLAFDRPFSAKSLKPVYDRNFVQLAIRPARLDAAKILPVTDSEIQKVFTYPYNPDTTRLRLILKTDNHWARGRVSLWNNNPKSVRVFVKDPLPSRLAANGNATRVVATAPVLAKRPQGKAPASAPAAAAIAASQTPSSDAPLEEKKLIAEVVNNTRDIDINNPDSVKAALATPPPVSAVDKSAAGEEKTGPIGISSDPTRHFTRMALGLFGVLALFIGGAFGVKKYAGKLKRLPFGKKERLIQVVATHYLGNKKSISLVKVTGEYMVVGVSNEGISLISKLGPEVSIDKYLEDRFWGGTFEKHLDHYASDAKSTKEIDLSSYDGVRDLAADGAEHALAERAQQFKDQVKIGAPKPDAVATPSTVRASIKEKLTKLKPLA